MISGDAAGAVGEGEAGAFSCHSGGEGGGEIGALSNGLDSGKAAVSLRSIQESSGLDSHVLANSMTG